jgi:hypothetical protein
VPVPALYRLGVNARQNLVGSLLLGIHPLLMLTPTADFLDAPGDHPQPVAGEDLPGSVLAPEEPEKPEKPVHVSIWMEDVPLGSAGPSWYEWFVGHFIKRNIPSDPEPTAPLARFLVAERSDAAAEPEAEQLQVMPKEEKAAKTDFTCPYLRQQAADRHARQMADPDVTQDVLGNLNKLLEADCLFELAGELLRAGCVSEAMDCYDAVCRLVPGSRFEAQVAEALAEFGIGAPTEAAEEPKGEPQGKVDTDFWLDMLGRLADVLGLPVPRFINVYSSDPNVRIRELINDSEDLRQIECEWKRIWFTDQPSHLTGEKAGVAEQVAGLMKACRLAAEAGDTGRAADLARQAYALDPECVIADPLVYKMHLLAADTQKDAQCPAAQCQPRGGLECPHCPNDPKGMTEEAEPPEMLRPTLPPVDPDVVNALDAMLHECRVLPAKPEANYPLCESEEHAAGPPPAEDGGLMDALPGLHGQMEFGIDLLDAGVRVSCDVRCAGKVFHVVYREGGFSFWTTHDASVATGAKPRRTESGLRETTARGSSGCHAFAAHPRPGEPPRSGWGRESMRSGAGMLSRPIGRRKGSVQPAAKAWHPASAQKLPAFPMLDSAGWCPKIPVCRRPQRATFRRTVTGRWSLAPRSPLSLCVPKRIGCPLRSTNSCLL